MAKEYFQMTVGESPVNALKQAVDYEKKKNAQCLRRPLEVQCFWLKKIRQDDHVVASIYRARGWPATLN